MSDASSSSSSRCSSSSATSSNHCAQHAANTLRRLATAAAALPALAALAPAAHAAERAAGNGSAVGTAAIASTAALDGLDWLAPAAGLLVVVLVPAALILAARALLWDYKERPTDAPERRGDGTDEVRDEIAALLGSLPGATEVHVVDMANSKLRDPKLAALAAEAAGKVALAVREALPKGREAALAAAGDAATDEIQRVLYMAREYEKIDKEILFEWTL